MDDWGKIAGIVAIVTIPLYASPLLVQPALRKIHDVASHIYYRNNRCQAIQWQHLHPGPIKPFALRRAVSTTARDGAIEAERTEEQDQDYPHIKAIVEFLQNVWQTTPRPIARPPYLHVAKNFIRLDADVLLVMVLLDGGSGAPQQYPGPGSPCTLRFGATAARLRIVEKEDDGSGSGSGSCSYIIGSLSGRPRFDSIRHGFHGLTKEDLRAIGGGYPPFYRHMLNTTSGAENAHPIQSLRDIHRAGWVLVIGFSTHPPLALYDSKRAPAYSEACDRVLETIQRLQREYASEAPHAALLDVAVKVVSRMNGYRSGSGAEAITRGTVLLTGDYKTICRSLSMPQLLFAINFFNEHRDVALSPYERERFEPILEEVLRAAVYGVCTWWQYANNTGRDIPGWLLDERVKMTPIWLEDSNVEGG
ncbi:hypothetical protein V8E51_007383 [Hyaloscypha variabilis]